MSVAETDPACSPFPTLASNLPVFRERLPVRPYCTDELRAGLQIRGAAQAALRRYVQPNGPTHCYWLAFDVDRPAAALDWDERHAPPPNIVVENTGNGHAHLLYGLVVAVRTAPDGRVAPLRYAAAVEGSLMRLLGADAGFAGLVVQNPCHTAWNVSEPHRTLYDLPWLADWLDLKAEDARGDLPAVGLGRNVALFEALRRWSYRAIRQGWPDFDRWLLAVETRAQGLNTAANPLPANEVRHIARSVAKWTHKRMTASGFSQVQAARGKRKGASRRDELLPTAREMAARGMPTREIARELGAHEATVRRWLQRPS